MVLATLDPLQEEILVFKKCKQENIKEEMTRDNQLKPADACENKEQWLDFKTPVRWKQVAFFFLFHAAALYYLFTFTFTQNWKTTLWIIAANWMSCLGVTGGVHRLWTHRSYKANMPLRVLLMLLFYTSGQKSIYQWVRDHRTHHKYTDTDADPHNCNRGLFFAHVGWLMLKRHPDVIRKGRLIDMSDILADPVVRFSERFTIPFQVMLTFVLPTLVPVYFFNETWERAIVSQCVFRYLMVLHITWSVNSFAHSIGNKPYDKNIGPAENKIVAILAVGEGWHNYHHVFPWDYKTGELGNYWTNLTTMFIDLFAMIGWAYDLREPSKEYVKMVIQNRGDGTHPIWSQTLDPKMKDS